MKSNFSIYKGDCSVEQKQKGQQNRSRDRNEKGTLGRGTQVATGKSENQGTHSILRAFKAIHTKTSTFPR
jgi:hypothetical protein